MSNRNFKTRVERLQESTAREKQRFSIRKLSVGAASVLLGTTLFFGTHVSQAHAATNQTDADKQANTDGTSVTENNNKELQLRDNLTMTTNQKKGQDNVTTGTTENTVTASSDTQNGGVSDHQQSPNSSTLSTDQDSDSTHDDTSSEKKEKKVEQQNNTNDKEATQTVDVNDLLSSPFNNPNDSKITSPNNEDQVTTQISFTDTGNGDNGDEGLKVVKDIPTIVWNHDKNATVGDLVTYVKQKIGEADTKVTPSPLITVTDPNLNHAAPYWYNGIDPYTGENIDDSYETTVQDSQNITQYDDDGNSKMVNLKQAYINWFKNKPVLAGFEVDTTNLNLNDKVTDNATIELLHHTGIYTGALYRTLTREIDYLRYYGTKNGNVITASELNSLKQSPISPVPGKDKIPGNSTTPFSIESKDGKLAVAWWTIGGRNYDFAIGTPPLTYNDNSNGTMTVVAFPEETRKTTNDGWKTFDSLVSASGSKSLRQPNTYYLLNTKYHYKDYAGQDHIEPKIDPVKIYYYHDQPVQIKFEDVTNGDNNAVTLADFDAKDLTLENNSKTIPATHDTAEKDNNNYTDYDYKAAGNYASGTISVDPTKDKSLKTSDKLTYDDVLNDYLDNGYVLVSNNASDVDLAYNKDQVWNGDGKGNVPTNTESDGHTLYAKQIVVKLKQVAHKVGPITKTITRTVHYKANSEEGDDLKDPIVQSATYHVDAYYADKDGNPVATTDGTDANGNSIKLVDPNGNAPAVKWTITSEKGKDTGVMPGDTYAIFNEENQDIIDVPDGSNKGKWIVTNDTKKNAPAETLNTDVNETEWSKQGYSNKDAAGNPGENYSKDVTLVYNQIATPVEHTKTVKRTVHYKTIDGKTLKNDSTDIASYSQDYYTNGNGDVVSTKEVTDEEGDSHTVVDQVLTGDDADKAKAWTLSSDNADFKEVDEPEINNGLVSGDWIRISATKNSKNGSDVTDNVVPAETISSDVTDNADQEYTITYAKRATPKTDTKTVTRTIHFVTDQDHGSKVLAPSEKQTVTYTSNYYVDDSGKEVAATDSGQKDKDGNPIYIVEPDTPTPARTWKTENATLPEVDNPDTYDNGVIEKNGVTWTTTDKAAEETVANDPSKWTYNTDDNQNYTLDTTLVYTQDVNADITYIDDTDNKTLATDTDKDEHGKVGDPIHFNKSPQQTIQDYKNEGYILVSNNLDDGTYKKDNNHYEVHFIHSTNVVPPSATPKYPSNVKSKDKKATQEVATHTVKYFDADNLDSNGNPTALSSDLAKTITQTVTWKRYAVYDTVNGDFLGYAKLDHGTPQVDKHGNTVVDTNLSDDNSWTITKDGKTIAGNTAQFDKVPSNDLSKKGYKQARSLNNSNYDAKDSGANVAAKKANFGDNTEDDVYYFHDIKPTSITKETKRTINFVAEDDSSNVLHDPIIQTVKYDGTTYVDQVTKTPVNAIKDANGDLILDKNGHSLNTIWTLNDSTKNFDKNINGFDKVSMPTIEKDNQTWYLTTDDPENKDVPNLTSDSQLPEDSVLTLKYKTKADYNVHYIDLGNSTKTTDLVPTDGTELTDHEITDIGKDNYVGDTPDESSKLWQAHTDDNKGYEDLGYVLVKADDNLADQKLTDGMNDQYVYLKHGTKTKESTPVSVTRHIYYWDATDGKKLDNLTAKTKPVTQTVNYNRIEVLDAVTGDHLGYTQDATTKTIDPSLDKTDGWFVTNGEFASVDSPDLTGYGYKLQRAENNDSSSMPAFDSSDKGKTVAAETVSIKDGNPVDGSDVNVYYFHDTEPVTSTSTDIPKDKDGNPVIDPSTLHKTVGRKIHFVERETNKTVAGDIPQTVNFDLTAIIDKVTGKVLGYDTTGDNKADFQDINQAWQNMPSKTLDAVTPDDYGYDHHDLSSVEAALVNVNSKPKDVTVKYWNDQGNFKVVYIDQDNNNQPIPNTEYDAPTQDLDTAITYKTQSTIDKLKDQGYELVTDGFTGQSGTTYTKDNNGKVFKVIFKHTTESVTSKDPKTPGTKITKDGNGKYPQGLDKDSLEVTKSRTINYVDGVTNKPVNGSPNGKSEEVQSVTFLKNPIIDRVTGKVLGYDTTGDGKVDTTNSDAAWYTENKGKRIPGNQVTLSSLESKTPSSIGYDEVDKNTVASADVTPTSSLSDETVKYYHYTLGKPENKTITRTINYVDEVTGEPISADKMPDGKNVVTQTITLTRTPYLDNEGNVVGYKVDGKFVPASKTDGWPTDKLQPVKSPDLTKDGYTPATSTDVEDPSLVPEVTVTENSPTNTTITIKYGHQTTSKEVKKDITRTITYIDRDTNKPVNGAPDGQSSYTQTVHFKMNEIRDAVTKELLGYDTTNDGKVDFTNEDEAWKNVPAQTLAQITSATPNKVGNYDQVDTPVVAKETVTADSNPTLVVVKYWKSPTAPVDQKAKVTIVDKTTGTTLTHFTDNNGKSGDPISFNGAKEALDSYLGLGYKFDSAIQDSDNSSIGKNADSIKYPDFDQDPDSDQNFTIYLTHDTEQKTETATTTSTVHYEVSDGKTPAPKDSKQTITWTRNVTTDKVTGTTTETPWTPADKSYSDVPTPQLDGYTPNKTNVPGEDTAYDKDPYTVVIYNPKEVVDQVANLRIVDKTNNEELAGFTSDHGEAGSPISFEKAAEVLKTLYDKGYTFDSAVQDSDNSSIGTKDNIKYPNFDNIPKNSQDFTIYLGHGTKDVSNKVETKAHVHYVVVGNDPDKPQAPADSPTQTITWTKTDTVDAVTGEVIKEGTWTSDKTSFDSVESPTVNGYTPDYESKEFNTPTRDGGDQTLLVVYTKNPTKRDDNKPSTKPDDNTPTTPTTPTVLDTPVVPDTPDVPDTPVTPTPTPEVEKHTVKISYVDENGNPIKKPVVEEDLTKGSSYNTATDKTKPKTITTKDGKTYQLTEVKKGSDAEKSTIQGKDVQVTYVYKLVEQGTSTPAKQEHSITVHYVDEHGNEITKPVVEKGKDGDKYDVTDKKKSTITKDGKTYQYKKTTGDSEQGTVDGKDVNVYYIYYTKLGTHTKTPTNPKKDKTTKHEKTVKKTKTSTKTNKFMQEVAKRHESLANKYRSTTPIHADSANWKTPANMPKSQTVDAQGNIIGPHGEILGYMKNGKPHYTTSTKTLPQTGEGDDSAMATAGIMTAMLGGVISAYGAGRRKKRRR